MDFGNAPCSWGVFYPTGNAITADGYLDAVKRAGYRATELGPLGFLPEEPDALADALGSRGLSLAGASHVHVLAEHGSWPVLHAALTRLGRVLQALNAPHLVLMDESEWYPKERQGVVDEAGWRNVVDLIERAQKYCADRFGIALHFHPHAGTCIEREAQIDRLLAETAVSLCFDTGHHAYWDQDPIAYMRKAWDRIGFVHLKNVNAAVRARMLKGELGVNQAFSEGVMCALPDGVLDMAAILRLLKERGFAGPVIVEQDPAKQDTPQDCESLAARNLTYLRGLA
jgi:inosose dehydratase